MKATLAQPQPRQRATLAGARSIIFWTIVALLGIAVVVLTVRILLVIFAGTLFAIVLRAATNFTTKHAHLPYGLSLTVIILVLSSAVALGVVLLIPRVSEQFEGFREALPPSIESAAKTLGIAGSLKETLQNAANLKDLNLEKILLGTVSTVGATFEVIAGFVICFFVAIYGAADPEAYFQAMLGVVPPRKRRLTKSILRVTVNNLERWLLGRLVAMLFVGVACAVAFVLLKVPLAIPLAILAGLLTFVEYIGAIASAVPAVLLGFGHGPTTALSVVVVFVLLHLIEGYWLTPLLAHASVHFPSGLTLVGQAIFGALVGPLGLTFSTPLLVVLVSAVKQWREEGASKLDSEADPRPAAS